MDQQRDVSFSTHFDLKLGCKSNLESPLGGFWQLVDRCVDDRLDWGCELKSWQGHSIRRGTAVMAIGSTDRPRIVM